MKRKRAPNGTSETYSLNVSVANTDLRMLNELHSMFSGTIRDITYGRNKRPTWVWQLSTKMAADALEAVAPYMVSKKDQAELALLSRKYKRHSRHDDKEKLEKQRELAKQITHLKTPQLRVIAA